MWNWNITLNVEIDDGASFINWTNVELKQVYTQQSFWSDFVINWTNVELKPQRDDGREAFRDDY